MVYAFHHHTAPISLIIFGFMEFGETKKTLLQIIIDYKYIDIKYLGNFYPFTANQ